MLPASRRKSSLCLTAKNVQDRALALAAPFQKTRRGRKETVRQAFDLRPPTKGERTGKP
jgi:hypothetical protein